MNTNKCVYRNKTSEYTIQVHLAIKTIKHYIYLPFNQA